MEEDEDHRPASHSPPIKDPLSLEDLPLLSNVSLYIHMPEEATVDFIVRLQQGALPRGLFDHHHLNGHHRRDEGEDEDEGEVDEEVEEAAEGEVDGHDGEDLSTWRVVDPHASADEVSTTDESEDFHDDAHPVTPPLVPLLTPRHSRDHRHDHPLPLEETLRESPQQSIESRGLLQRDSAAFTSAGSSAMAGGVVVPPLDLFRLFPPCCHINLLLYDGLREDIAFSYFQFMQHLSSQLKERRASAPSLSSPASPSSFYIPPTVLLLYNGWQILQRCEQDEETEERIKKLLNLCDVVVVTDEELCGAYSQLCPNVLVIPHGYHSSEGEDEEAIEGDEQRVGLSPLSSSASSSSQSSLSSASSLFFSPVPRAPVSSPAGSPPPSPKGSKGSLSLETVSTPSSSSSSSSSLSAFDHSDLVQAVNDKRGRLHLPYSPPVLSYIPAPLPSLPLAIPASSTSAPSSPIHIIGYLPTDDDNDESHRISWPDVWALRTALLSLSTSSTSPPPRHLFFLYKAPITVEEQPMVTFLTAPHLEQHYSGSYHDVATLRAFLYQQSHEGQKVVVVYGLFCRVEVQRLCREMVDFELRVSRDVDDGGWVGGRMHRAVPIVLQLSNSLAHIRQGAHLIVIARADGKECKVEAAGEREWEDGEEEEEADVTPGSPTLSTLSSSSSMLSSDDFSFSPSYHLYPSDHYDYAGAAMQLMSMMGREGGVAEALRWNGRVMREWSLDRVAALYLRVMEEQLMRKDNGGREGAMVTRASWYST